MNGYLQRLTASVIKPTAAIHPILGSVFSPSTPIAPAEHAELISPRAAVAESVRSAPVVPTPRSVETDNSVASDESEAPAQERVGFRALVDPPQRRQETALPIPAAIAAPEHFARNQMPEPVLEPSRPAEHRSSVPSESTQLQPKQSVDPTFEGSEPSAAAMAEPPQRETVVYRPLIEESLQRQTPPAILQTKFQEGRNAEKRNSQRQQQAPRHEPDEIQIHIGRIEVVAAPPAPVRVEPRQARPSPNLGDYLKRRHGRA